MRKWAVIAVLIVSIARFGHVAYQGLTYSIGDFYSTLPGAYVESLNPTLWASPDLTNVRGRASNYQRGPTQYLTAYPLSFLDSYREIANVLLVVYALLIPGAAYLMWRTFAPASRDYQLLAMVISSSLLFFPTLQAYIAREFELVTMAGTVLLFTCRRSDGSLPPAPGRHTSRSTSTCRWRCCRTWWCADGGARSPALPRRHSC